MFSLYVMLWVLREDLSDSASQGVGPLVCFAFAWWACEPCRGGFYIDTRDDCSMLIWRGCWPRPTKIRTCLEIWKIIIGHECTCARQGWKCSKDGWLKHKNEGKGPTPSTSWLRLLWRSMALNNSAPARISKNFWAFWVIFYFSGKKQVFAFNGSCPPRDPFVWQLHFGKTQHFWICHEKLHMLSHCQEISSSFGPPESQKTSKKMTFCLIFDTQKAVLGDCNFGGANDHQIQKFHLGWKVDIQTFPTSPLLPHLDTWKCLKSALKGARPIRQFAQEFSLQLSKTQFWLGLTFWSWFSSSLL